jgi:hypothetical protein
MKGRTPLATQQIIEEYFIENRTRVLDVAAFLDRLDRSSDGKDPSTDFRVRALLDCLHELVADEPGRVERIQLILSDPTSEPRETLDRKGAYGAFDPGRGAR